MSILVLKPSVERLKQATQSLSATLSRLNMLVQDIESRSPKCISSGRTIRSTCASSGPEISGIYAKRRDFVVYISAPITAEHPYQREQNIYVGRKLAEQFWMDGFTVLCPQLNTAHMDGLPGMTHSDWLEGDFNFIERVVDLAFFGPKWMKSNGCVKENNKCRIIGVPCFTDRQFLIHYADRVIRYCQHGRWDDDQK